MFRQRGIGLAIVFGCLFALLLGRLAYLQIYCHAHYRESTERRIHRLRTVPPSRGTILDKRGRVLAKDAPAFELRFRPAVRVREGRRRVIRGSLEPVLSVEQLLGLAARPRDESFAFERDLAIKRLVDGSPLVARLAELIPPDDEAQQPGGGGAETPRAARARIAAALLDAALHPRRRPRRAVDLLDPRPCFRDVSQRAYLTVVRDREDPFGDGVFAGMLPGIRYRREYPHGAVVGHLTGATGGLTAREYDRLRGTWPDRETGDSGQAPRWSITYGGQPFVVMDPESDEARIIRLRTIRVDGETERAAPRLPNDTVGRGGLEQYYNQRMRGRHVRRLQRLARPTPHGPRVFLNVQARPTPAEHGRPVRLTLDASLQERARAIMARHLERYGRDPGRRRALGRARRDAFPGVAIVMDCDSGAIRALVSLPDYDPNRYNRDFTELAKDRNKPLINRAIQEYYPPGSTIKPLLALAALQTGAITERTEFTCEHVLELGTNRYVCMGRHGAIDVRTAIKKSCNIFFYHNAEALRSRPMHTWLRKLGLGQKTGIDLAGEKAGYLPAAAYTGKRWSLGQSYHLGIGQGELDVTPLQMAVAYAALANGGAIVRPHLREDPRDPSLASPLRQLSLDPYALRIVREGMYQVVQERGGTGYKHARIDGFEYAAKSGSAQHTRGTHAWFCGYAPYRQPEIAFVVLVPYGNHGGETAGPIAADLLRLYFDLPEYTEDADG